MTDHRALIEETRKRHSESELRRGDCAWCLSLWPCIAVRLADALADALDATTAEAALHDLARQERAAAERRVAEETERAEVAEAGLHRYGELYEASHAALLARQAATEKQEPARHPSDCECYPCWQRSES